MKKLTKIFGIIGLIFFSLAGLYFFTATIDILAGMVFERQYSAILGYYIKLDLFLFIGFLFFTCMLAIYLIASPFEEDNYYHLH